MTACRYNPDLGYRVLARGDADEPCPHRHCLVCGRNHCDHANPQTCPECVRVVREDLTVVVDLEERRQLTIHLGDIRGDGRLNTGPLGGDAMTMGAEGRYLPARLIGPDHYRNDPTPTLTVLVDIEDQWRIELGHGGGPRATVWRAADYIGQHLTMMAQRFCAFDENASALAQLRGRLEAILHDGDREDHADVSCFECGGRLVRKVTNHGADDCWTCGRCRRRYTDPEYHLAVRAKLEAIRDQEAS